jgi:Na+-driven multidrug efflux pump
MESLEAGTIQMAGQEHKSFLVEPIGKLLLRSSGSAIAAMLLMSIYQVADGIMVGRRLGADALAAVNLVYPVIALIVGLAVMIGTGGNARIAVLMGSGKTTEARRILGLITALGAGLGLTGSVIVASFGGPLLALLGSDAGLDRLALQYLIALAPFFIAFILTFILDLAVRNDGRPGLATAVVAGCAGLNIVLDYLFLFVLDLGMAGAALASGISQGLGAGVFLLYFIRKAVHRMSGLRLGLPGGGMPAILVIIQNGSSELLSSLALGLTTLLFNRKLMEMAGSSGVAAYALVQYILMFVLVFFNGLATGMQAVIGSNRGAGRMDRVDLALSRVLVAGLIMALCLALLTWWVSPWVVAVFVPESVLAAGLASLAARTIAWAIPLMSVGIITSMFFTSLELAGRSMLIACIRGLVLPVLCLSILPRFFGTQGIWLVPVFSEAVAAVIALILLTIYRQTGRSMPLQIKNWSDGQLPQPEAVGYRCRQQGRDTQDQDVERNTGFQDQAENNRRKGGPGDADGTQDASDRAKPVPAIGLGQYGPGYHAIDAQTDTHQY